MGAAARAHLTPGQRGTVLAALSNATYLLTDSRELLWLASDGAPLHRRCVKTTAPFPRPAAGASFSVSDRCLRIDGGLVFDSATASVWEPPRIDRGRAVAMGEIGRSVRALAADLDFSQAQGFGRFIPAILQREPGFAAATQDPVLAHARPIVLDIADACRRQDMRRVAHCADALIGLGSGLTPSGDDFLGGLLFGLKALRAAYPGVGFLSLAIPSEHHRTRTHPISFVLLDDLANGHGIAPLHHIINGILCGESTASLRPAILQLTQVGHSTGWDMLAGLLAGLLTAPEAGSVRT